MTRLLAIDSTDTIVGSKGEGRLQLQSASLDIAWVSASLYDSFERGKGEKVQIRENSA